MTRKRARERELRTTAQLLSDLAEYQGAINEAHNRLREWVDSVVVPHTALPSVQSTYRFLQIAGDHIAAAITLIEIDHNR
jgi:hypothetical protein